MKFIVTHIGLIMSKLKRDKLSYFTREFVMVDFFNSPSTVSKHIATYKIPKKKILSIVFKEGKYVLFYYTTMYKEDKYMIKLKDKHIKEIQFEE